MLSSKVKPPARFVICVAYLAISAELTILLLSSKPGWQNNHFAAPTMSLPYSSLAAGQSTVSSSRKNPRKPKRPLTAYHIYFQIEREFIIQNMMAGTDTDKGKSIHEGKTLFYDVPKRYKDTKLSPDWFFGPGRRAKRKHRKQHGKIGFLELSRVITSRWNKLDETDPDVKQFVFKLASQQFDEYKRELKEYRDVLTKNMITPVDVSKRSSKMKQQTTVPQAQEQQQIETTMSKPKTMEYQPSSFLQDEQPCAGRSSMTSTDQLCQTSDRIDLAALSEVFELEYANSYQQKGFQWGVRKIEDDFVDLCDDDILSMWKSTHARAA